MRDTRFVHARHRMGVRGTIVQKVLKPVYTQSLDYCKRSRRGPVNVRCHPRAARVVHNSVLLRNEHPNADIHISRVELG